MFPSSLQPSDDKRAMLVYQAGIANVFEVQCFNLNPFGRSAKRLMQADFRSCENFAQGLGAAGYIVRTAVCNRAGDIKNQVWSLQLAEVPFVESFRPLCIN